MANFTIEMSAKENGATHFKSFDFYTNCLLTEDGFKKDFQVFNPTLTDIKVVSFRETFPESANH